MRQSYTPIFHSTVNSRVWALSPAARCVWLWLHLSADPEGFVCATVAGVAVGANVDVSDARRALDGFEQPDPDALPGEAHEGRVIERVARGWRILGFEELRDLARYQARKARQRRYMKALRDEKASNDVSSEGSPKPTVTPTKTKTKTDLVSKDTSISQPAAASSVVVSTRRTLMAFPDTWQPSESLRADAAIAGVVDFEKRLAGLRRGPIGGARGIFEDQLDDYVRSFFGTWRTWDETARANLKNSGRSSHPFPAKLEPTPKHRSYAKKHNIRLDELILELERSGAVDSVGAKRALEMVGEKMSRLVREREAAA